MNNNQIIISPNPTKEVFIENIKKWVYFDKKIQEFNKNKQLAKTGKDATTEVIINYFQQNPSLNDIVEISNGNIRLCEKKEYSPLTFTYVEETLHKIISNEDDVAKIIQILKENREVKTVKEIKRSYK